MPYYGRQPSGQDLQRASGGNPFYNPYSPYPNIGMGIASTFGNIMAMKEMRQQEDYDKEQEEKAYKLKERQIAAQEKSLEPKTRVVNPTDLQRQIDAYIIDHPGKTQWDAIMEIKGYGTNTSAFKEKVSALVATGMAPDKAIREIILGSQTAKKTTDPQWSKDIQFGKTLSSDLRRYADSLEGFDIFGTQIFGDSDDTKKRNVGLLQMEAARLNNAARTRSWTKEEGAMASFINANYENEEIHKIMSDEEFIAFWQETGIPLITAIQHYQSRKK